MYRLTKIWQPTDSRESGTVSSNTNTTITDNTKSWADDQLVGMAFKLTSWQFSGIRYTITGNTATTITLQESLPQSVAYTPYVVAPYTESHYLDCCNLADWEKDARGRKTYCTL